MENKPQVGEGGSRDLREGRAAIQVKDVGSSDPEHIGRGEVSWPLGPFENITEMVSWGASQMSWERKVEGDPRFPWGRQRMGTRGPWEDGWERG